MFVYKRIKVWSVMLFILIMTASCTKNVEGPQGDPGQPGKNGNMLLSDTTFTVAPANWKAIDDGWETFVSFPRITPKVMSSGEVKVYLQVNGSWWTLTHANGNIITQVRIQSELIYLTHEQGHGGPAPRPGFMTFRAVVMQPAK